MFDVSSRSGWVSQTSSAWGGGGGGVVETHEAAHLSIEIRDREA
jgi:hypothetical protein